MSEPDVATIVRQIKEKWAVMDEHGKPVSGDAVGGYNFPLEHATEFAQYHPKNLHLHRFAHDFRMAFEMTDEVDAKGYPVLRVGGTGDGWPANMKTGLFDKLRLEVHTIEGGELKVVEDSNISFRSGEWRVIKYRSTLTFDDMGNEVFRDELTWIHDDGEKRDSSWGWRIYLL